MLLPLMHSELALTNLLSKLLPHFFCRFTYNLLFLNAVRSTLVNSTSGMVQETIISPTMVILYTNDEVKSSNLLNFTVNKIIINTLLNFKPQHQPYVTQDQQKKTVHTMKQQRNPTLTHIITCHVFLCGLSQEIMSAYSQVSRKNPDDIFFIIKFMLTKRESIAQFYV